MTTMTYARLLPDMVFRGRGDETVKIKQEGFRARRWVVERTHSWINRFRGLLNSLVQKKGTIIWDNCALLVASSFDGQQAYWDRLLIRCRKYGE